MERFADMADRENGQNSTAEIIGAVRELVSLMSKGGISELDLSAGNVSIRLRAATSGQATHPPDKGNAIERSEHPTASDEGHVVTAPMIGTFYSAPSPGEDPFVRIGDEVEVGQVVGIIEAMKIMNEIVADKAGVVAEIMVENAQAVEYGSPLVRLAEQTDTYM